MYLQSNWEGLGDDWLEGVKNYQASVKLHRAQTSHSFACITACNVVEILNLCNATLRPFRRNDALIFRAISFFFLNAVYILAMLHKRLQCVS